MNAEAAGHLKQVQVQTVELIGDAMDVGGITMMGGFLANAVAKAAAVYDTTAEYFAGTVPATAIASEMGKVALSVSAGWMMHRCLTPFGRARKRASLQVRDENSEG